VVCITHDRIRAAKRRNIIGPPITCYITYITLIIRLGGREYVGVSECVNVLEQGGKRYGVAKLSKLVLAFIIINYQAD